MSKLRTHYDNLKVARNAPPEVIRAAYRVLTQKYHPDRHPGDAAAARIMLIVNNSYEVLSDPEKRSAHDRWIADVEREIEAKHERRRQIRQATEAEAEPGTDLAAQLDAEQAERRRLERLLDAERRRTAERFATKPVRRNVWAKRPWLHALLILLVPTLVVASLTILAYKAGSWDAGFRKLSRTIPRFLAALSGSHPLTPARQAGKDGAKSAPCRAGAGYVKPAVGPNGIAWPAQAEYLAGSKVRRNQGSSSMTVDNARNGGDVLARLVLIGSDRDTGELIEDSRHLPPWQSMTDIRVFFVPAYGSFTMKAIEPGSYELRYRDLSRGVDWKSEVFAVVETPPASGSAGTFSSINMLLYRGTQESCYAELPRKTGVDREAGNGGRDLPRPEGAPLWDLSNRTVHERVERR